ncbi:WWE domain protein (macronuclear) [Tetrahymena thermophila SB210]|uniref:WWE domain protein n=1 Tax=Tetrahymena thermophila (strain SB210) TaxID=312017 RepID=Q24G67_TETTS|nr:WWE domain protein [Tetrahymena thermophila SB210]EAS06786.1 WWE domain protein [Tetrahymena thermophila SB210]|eukprot:XP_001027028.1 WWE domain protein [Tetrahymena thermophila SB210]
MEQIQQDQQGLISWYCYNAQNVWVPYSDNIQMCLEDCFQKYLNNQQSNPIVQCLINNKNYIIDVKENTQKNKKTGTTRKILRIADDNKQQVQQLNVSIQQQDQKQQKNNSVWQFLGDLGWRNYDEDSQKLLVKKYNQYKLNPENEQQTFQLSIAGSIYKINFKNMTQQNLKYQTIRQIRLFQNVNQ